MPASSLRGVLLLAALCGALADSAVTGAGRLDVAGVGAAGSWLRPGWHGRWCHHQLPRGVCVYTPAVLKPYETQERFRETFVYPTCAEAFLTPAQRADCLRCAAQRSRAACLATPAAVSHGTDVQSCMFVPAVGAAEVRFDVGIDYPFEYGYWFREWRRCGCCCVAEAAAAATAPVPLDMHVRGLRRRARSSARNAL